MAMGQRFSGPPTPAPSAVLGRNDLVPTATALPHSLHARSAITAASFALWKLNYSLGANSSTQPVSSRIASGNAGRRRCYDALADATFDRRGIPQNRGHRLRGGPYVTTAALQHRTSAAHATEVVLT